MSMVGSSATVTGAENIKQKQKITATTKLLQEQLLVDVVTTVLLCVVTM
jgi:hypothetical protein